MSENKFSIKLGGSASWLAITSAAFFWLWLDRVMFGSTLLSSNNFNLNNVLFISIVTASVLALIGVLILVSKRAEISPWRINRTVVFSIIGFFAGALCIVSNAADYPSLHIVAFFLLGFSMGCLNVVWGIIAIAQGVEKAILHISGAWAIGALLNALCMLLPSAIESWLSVLLPLFSLVGYISLFRLQGNKRYKIDLSNRRPLSQDRHKSIFSVDVFFLVVIIVFCCIFGFVCWQPQPHVTGYFPVEYYLVFARCLTALVFFCVCYFISAERIKLLLMCAFSLMAVGVVVLTVSMFAPEMSLIGRILTAIGYSGFDILVWTLVAYYAHSDFKQSIRVIALIMAAEQVGILIGGLVSIFLISNGMAASVTSIFMIIVNYIWLVSCFLLLRRYDKQSVFFNEVSSDSSLSSEISKAVLLFSENAGLTTREKEIVLLLAEGRNVPYIAEKFVVSANTVKSHVRHIYEKGNIHNRQELLDEIESLRQSK